MARFRSDRLRRASVEHVLDGHPGMPVSRALNVLVAAGRAPAHQGELAGEESAVAAFRAARTAAPAASAAPMRRSLTRLLTVKVVAAVTVLAGGGLAVAAATGTLPSVPFLPESPPSQSVGPTGSGYGPTGTSPLPGTTGPSGSGTGPGGPAGVGTPGTVPAPAVPGLCRAYLAMPAGQARRAVRTPPFADLVAAAGSVDAVPGYCEELVGPSATAPAPPAPTGEPSGPPAAASPPAPAKSPKAPKTPKTQTSGKATADRPPPPSL